MRPKVISESTTEPLTLAEVVEASQAYSTASDAQTGHYLEGLITAARKAVEEELEMSLVEKTLEVSRTSFYPARIELPYGPVRSVVSVYYLDLEGADTLLAADQYRISLYDELVAVTPGYDVTWPDYRRDTDSIRVRYTAGYPSSDSPPQTVPQPILQAMHLMIRHWYDHRGAVDDDSLMEMPLGARYLLWKYRRGLGV